MRPVSARRGSLTIVLDTSGLLAAVDGSQPEHAEARAALESDRGPLLLSPFVLQELDHLLITRLGVDAELVLLDEVARGRYQLESFVGTDVAQATELVDRYRDLGIGLADASVVMLAARHSTERILTLDERHFRAIRPLRGRAFTILPADA